MHSFAAFLAATSAQITAHFIVLLAFVVIEVAAPKERFSLRSRLPGAAFWLIWLVAAGVIGTLLHELWQLIGLRPLLLLRFQEWFSWAGSLAALTAGITTLLLVDFFEYWHHRFQHKKLWSIHAVHHSVEDLNAVNSYAHFSDPFFRFLLIGTPLSMIPTDSVAPAAVTAYALLGPHFLHANTRLSWGALRYLIPDNRYHRIHHSCSERHYDKNFGVYTTIWDQVFGTAYFPKKGEWPATGLQEMRQPRTVTEFILYPLRHRYLTRRPSY